MPVKMKSNQWHGVYLGVEFILLFFGVPLFIYFEKKIIHPTIILLPVLLMIFLILRYGTDSFKFRELISMQVPGKFLWKNILAVMLVGFLMAAWVFIFDRSEFLNLPKGNLLMWFGMCLFYPIISAWGQEIIYRTFMFHRYKKLFDSKWVFITLSAIAFSFLHIVYYHPVSIILTLIMGFYIAYIYEKTRSVIFVAILHGLLGIMVFTVGLGQYFWLDMHKWLP